KMLIIFCTLSACPFKSETETCVIFISNRTNVLLFLKDTSQICPSAGHRDWLCPVCLQTASFPVQNNCGHLYCAPCLISYWRLGSWLDAISCPLCRQRVRKTPNCRNIHYYHDITLLAAWVLWGGGGGGGAVCPFFLRVVLCCLGAMVSLSSAPLDTSSSLSGFLGLLDDLVVVFLLLTCVNNINQQMAPEGELLSTHSHTGSRSAQ
uniref:Si:dkey-183n20.15 n=1 Tax=Oncorhynchus mykiss TaxID=8022 RepID=A0A8C7T750_ONCMY